MEVDIPAFRRLTAGTAVKLYPSNDFVHVTDGYKPIPLKVGRGIYANWWHQAHIFNLMYDLPTFQRPSASLLIGVQA